MKYLFVLGSHRTGTKLLANFFDEVVPETKGVHQYPQLQKNNILANLHLTGALPKGIYESLIQKNWVEGLKTISSSDFDLYVESNGFNYHCVSQARSELGPEQVLVLHVVRDPKDSLVSHMNWIEGRSKSKLANKYVPYWNLNSRYNNEVTFLQWQKKSLVEQLAYNWKWKNEIIEEMYSDGQYLLVRFEDIVDEGQRASTLAEVADFAGKEFPADACSYFDVKQNSSARVHFPEWEDWQGELKSSVAKICSPLDSNYGYELS